MANEEHLAILRQGVEAWNAWRKEHRDVRPNLRDADLIRANLIGAELIGADLIGAHLSRADLGEAHLRWARLTGAHLSGAHLSGAEFIGAHLNGANLSGADLNGANLTGAHLSGAHLNGANLSGAELNGANLRRADLRRADLSGADLRDTDLRDANLSEADLIQANFSQAELNETDFSNARIGTTILALVDLSVVKGLDTVRHFGPSEIGITTLYESKGNIPEVFLRGCGLPEAHIEYLPSFLGAMQPIQFYSCFISYSHQNEDFAHRLHQRMQAEKLRVWYAPEDMKAGRKLHEQIDEAIRIFDKLVLVLSSESIESEWVMTEIRKARKAELRDKRRRLFPIRLVEWDTIREWECFDADTGKDLAVEVREYFVPDFTRWKDHDAFEAGFSRLLRDLKAEA